MRALTTPLFACILPLVFATCQGGKSIPNGQWDFTLTRSQYSRGTVAIADQRATLTLVKTDEGATLARDCQRMISRVEVQLAVQDGRGTGDATYVSQDQGSGCAPSDSQPKRSLLTTFTVVRSAGTGTGIDNPEGTWTLQGARPRDVGELTFSGGLFTGNFAMRTSYTFTGSLMDRTVQGTDTNGASLSGMLK